MEMIHSDLCRKTASKIGEKPPLVTTARQLAKPAIGPENRHQHGVSVAAHHAHLMTLGQ